MSDFDDVYAYDELDLAIQEDQKDQDYPSWGESFFIKKEAVKEARKIKVVHKPQLSTRKWEAVSTDEIKRKLTKEEEDAISIASVEFHPYEGLYAKPLPLINVDENPSNGSSIILPRDVETYLRSFINDADKFMALFSKVIPDQKKELTIVDGSTTKSTVKKPSKKTTKFSFQQTEEEKADHKLIIKKFMTCQIEEEYEKDYQDKVSIAEENGEAIPQKDALNIVFDDDPVKVAVSSSSEDDYPELASVKTKQKKVKYIKPDLFFKHKSKEMDSSRYVLLRVYDPLTINGIYCKLYIQYYSEILKSWIDPAYMVDIPRIAVDETVMMASPKKINIFNTPISVFAIKCHDGYRCRGFLKQLFLMHNDTDSLKDFKYDSTCNMLHVDDCFFQYKRKRVFYCSIMGCTEKDHYLPAGITDAIIMHIKMPREHCNHETSAYCKQMIGEGCNRRHKFVGPQIMTMILRNIFANKFPRFEDWPTYNNDAMYSIVNKLLNFPVPRATFKDTAMTTVFKMLLTVGSKYDWPHTPNDYFDTMAANVINLELSAPDNVILTIMKESIEMSFDIKVANLKNLVEVMKTLRDRKSVV